MRHRVATAHDARLYFDWANEPVTRQQSFNSAPILWEAHKAWFARKVDDPNVLLLVFESEEGEPVGQVRFERQADGEVIIGLSVDSSFRGRGLASQLIREACAVFQANWRSPVEVGQVVPISAYVKPDNKPSIRAFERAGFTYSHESRKFGVESVCLTFS